MVLRKPDEVRDIDYPPVSDEVMERTFQIAGKGPYRSFYQLPARLRMGRILTRKRKEELRKLADAGLIESQ